MNDDDLRKLTGQAQLDQVNAGMANFATILGSFYTGLIESGVPDVLAHDLTQDYFRRQLQKMLWPDDPPTWEG